ncbi:MAG: efflux RND transporter periplasmic adaptor subunit [Betaproteobacteria bacterium]|nr:efflux RND transporter periplasmic adaptor subunit [Pseudomonadota bacterium]NBO12161.1 efflux RND transporter periplasmic adaptor subunit [Betaproteobacteria bacterium]NBO44010.1 efflux RND transporter periplasmic adaptor subunit [Betaproteobacteria bacterium]NBP10822.1 efflux RND transporter periplasmic adaptor subunit [Betaproteobacteria bacterium]NBP61469.1 efflux RND transporter periplasmic adaptor subunit [Betaproteobacteria bacterium]
MPHSSLWQKLKIDRVPAWGLSLALLAAVLAGHAEASGPGQSKNPSEKPVMKVETSIVTQIAAAQRIQAQGSLQPWREAVVSPQVQGLAIVELHAELGDKVEQGQMLARLDQRLPLAELAQAKAQGFEARASLDEAQLQLERAQQLREKGFFSESQLTQAQNQRRIASARVDAAQAAIELRSLQLKQTEVRASESGVISAKTALLGAIPPLGAELFKILVQGKLEWRAEVTSQDLERIAPGQRARINLPSGESLDAKVRLLSPSIDPGNRNAQVLISLSTTPRQLRAGQFVQGSIDVGLRSVMSLPQSALVVRDGFTLVFHIDKQQRVRSRKVKAGAIIGDQVEILEGIEAGALVVARGGAFLNDGDLVSTAKP